MLGESTGFELGNTVPSKAGLQTVLEVVKIQMQIWSSLKSIFAKLQLKWEEYCSENKSEKFPVLFSNFSQVVDGLNLGLSFFSWVL